MSAGHKPRTVGSGSRPSRTKRRRKNKGGRPSSYRQEYAAQAKRLCLLGYTDIQLAEFFGVSEKTINNWKLWHKEFLQSLKDGKDNADSLVADSLFQRARGYSHSAVKIFADPKTGSEQIVPYTEHYPPDTVACIFWLKNRRKDQWRDKTEHEHSGKLSFEELITGSNDDGSAT